MSMHKRILCFPPFLLLMRCWGGWGEILQAVQGGPTPPPSERAEVVMGGRVELPCQAAADKSDVMVVLWYHQSFNRPIYSYDVRNARKPQHLKSSSSLGERARYEPSASPPVLQLHAVTPDDAGHYRCRVDFRKKATATSDVLLTVVVPPLEPVLYLGDGTQVGREQSYIGPFLPGQSVQVECRVAGGEPPPIVTWWRGGEMIKNKDQQPDSSSRKRRRGIYTTNTSVTTATKVSPDSSLTPAALVSPSKSPLLLSTSPPSSLTTSPVSFPPSSYTSPQPVVISTLHIDRLTREDLHTSFVCQASNSNLTAPRQVTVTIEMYFPPEHVTLLGARGGPLSAGKPYELTCSSKGARPPASITWWLEGNQLTNVTSAVHSAGQETRSVLTLVPRPSDGGKFLKCQAESPAVPHATVVDAVRLEVYYKPKATVQLNKASSMSDILDTTSVNSVLTSVTVKERGDIILHCSVVANPRAFRVVWRKDGEEVLPSKIRDVVAGGQVLRVVSAARVHAGTYTCSSSNVEGEASSAGLNLQVAFPPECAPGQLHVQGAARGEAITIKCQVLSFPAPSRFEWHLNTTRGKVVPIPEDQITTRGGVSTFVYTPYSRHDYGNLVCRAVNVVGRQEEACVYKVVPAGIPDAPENCTVVHLQPFAVHVQCLAGYDGGLPQTFIGEAYEADSRTLISNCSNALQPFLELENLTPNTAFLVSVYAVNVKGASRRKILYVTTPSDVTERRIDEGGDSISDVSSESDGTEEDGNLFSSLLDGTPFLALLVGALCGFVLVALVAAVVVFRLQKACRGGRHPSSPARGCPRASPATTSTCTSTTASLCSKRGLLFSDGDVPHLKRADLDPLHKARQRKCNLIPFEASTILEVEGENDEGYEDADDDDDEEESLWEEDEELEYMEDETEPYGKENQRTALALIRNNVGQWTRPEDNEVIYGVGNLRHLRFGQSRSPLQEGFLKSKMKKSKNPIIVGKSDGRIKNSEAKKPNTSVATAAVTPAGSRGDKRGSGRRVGVCLPTRGKRHYSRKRHELEETDSSEISTYTRPSLIVSRVPKTIAEVKQGSRKASKSQIQRENSINNKNSPKVAQIRKGGRRCHRANPRVCEPVKVVKPPSPVYSTPVVNPQTTTIAEITDDHYESVETPQESPTSTVATATNNNLVGLTTAYEGIPVDVSVRNQKNQEQSSIYHYPDPEIISAFRPYVKPEFETPNPQVSNRVPKSPLPHPNSKLQNAVPPRKVSSCTPPSLEINQTTSEEHKHNVSRCHAEEAENRTQETMITSFNDGNVEEPSPGEVLPTIQPSPLRRHPIALTDRSANSNVVDLQHIQYEQVSPTTKVLSSPQFPTSTSHQEVKSQSKCITQSTRQQRPIHAPTIHLQLQPQAQPSRSQPGTPEPQGCSEPLPSETKSSPRIVIQQDSPLQWPTGESPSVSQACAITRMSPSLLQMPSITDASPMLSQTRSKTEAPLLQSQAYPLKEKSPSLSQTPSMTDASSVITQSRSMGETSPSLSQTRSMREASPLLSQARSMSPPAPSTSRPSPPQRIYTSFTSSSSSVTPSKGPQEPSSSSVCPPHRVSPGSPSPLVCPQHSIPQGPSSPSVCLPYSVPEGPPNPSACPPHNLRQGPSVSGNSSHYSPLRQPHTSVVSIPSQCHATPLTAPFVVSLPSFSGVTRSESPRQSTRPEEPQRRSPSSCARSEVQRSSPSGHSRLHETHRVSPASHIPGTPNGSNSRVSDGDNHDPEELPTATITSTRPRASPRVRPLDRSGQRLSNLRNSPRHRSFHVVPPVSPEVVKTQLKASKSYN